MGHSPSGHSTQDRCYLQLTGTETHGGLLYGDRSSTTTRLHSYIIQRSTFSCSFLGTPQCTICLCLMFYPVTPVLLHHPSSITKLVNPPCSAAPFFFLLFYMTSSSATIWESPDALNLSTRALRTSDLFKFTNLTIKLKSR